MIADVRAAFAPRTQHAYQPMDRRGFDALLALGRAPAGDDPRTVQQAATGLVSNLFFAPMLEEMRRLPFGGPVGSGGREEQVFGQQLDQHIADSVAGANAGGLTHWIRKKIEQSGRPVAPPAAPANRPTLLAPPQVEVTG